MTSAIRTFPDAGVLIAAARRLDPLSKQAGTLLIDPQRVFLTSRFVQLEVAPKASYHQRDEEAEFYRRFFDATRGEWASDLTAICSLAETESARSGLNAMDSLHVAAAHLLGANEFITTERPGKSIYRTTLVKVIPLLP